MIISLDVSQNTFFKDPSLALLAPVLPKLSNLRSLKYLSFNSFTYSLERTEVTDASLRPLLESLPAMSQLQYLSVSSNSLSSAIFEQLIALYANAPIALKTLDLSNNKMGEKMA